MYFAVFCAGILVGALIMGSFVLLKNFCNKPDKNKSVQAMREYIFELENERDELLERNNRLKEKIVRDGY